MNYNAEFFGLVIVILGLFARHQKFFNLITGHDKDRVRDPEGLEKWVSTNIIIAGLFLMTFGTWEPTSRYPIAIAAVIVIIAGYSAIGAKRFLK